VNGSLTPIQQKMLDMLSDGAPHSREELCTCLFDDLGNPTNIHAHLTLIRQFCRPRGEDIVSNYDGRWTYRLVRLMGNPYRG